MLQSEHLFTCGDLPIYIVSNHNLMIFWFHYHISDFPILPLPKTLDSKTLSYNGNGLILLFFMYVCVLLMFYMNGITSGNSYKRKRDIYLRRGFRFLAFFDCE